MAEPLDCSNSAVFYTASELKECSRRACEEGNVLTDWWQTRADANACAQKWQEKTGVPHYITEKEYCADDAPVCTTVFTMHSCPIDKVFDSYMEDNEGDAAFCAAKWRGLAKSEGSGLQYRAKLIARRSIFSDIWMVSVKAK